MNLPAILPLVQRSGFWFQLLTRSLLVTAICFSMLLLALRYWLLPDIDHYRQDIAAVITQAAGQRVTIGAVSAEWDGLRPNLILRTVQVHNKEGDPALILNLIESTLSWLSILHGEVRFHTIRINKPDLTIRRDTEGIIHVAGVALSPDQSESGFADWLLRQRQLILSDANIVWQDDQRGSPALELKAVNLRLENRGQHHRFGIHAVPPSNLAAPLDIRGDFTGDSLGSLEKWRGQIFTQLDYADIAAWRPWLPFPETIEFNRGAGSIRMWLGIDGTVVEGLTADVRLQNVKTRLAQELPELNLISLKGRVGWKRINNGTDEGTELSTRGLSISIHGEETLQPLNLSLQTVPTTTDKSGSGKLNLNVLDLETLMNLVEYLPVQVSLRERLDELSPIGEIRDVQAEWNGEWPTPSQFNIKGGFTNLGMKKFYPIPAFRGISGNIAGTEKVGTLNLSSQKVSMALPEALRKPVMLDRLNGQVNWESLTDKSLIEFKFNSVEFANDHAAGSVSGSYHSVPDGPDMIDLNAHLTQADARYVGQYVPTMVSQSVRDWIERSIVAGDLSDVRLRLKGNLAEFPFNNNENGIFQINAKASSVKLDYLSEWPKIENISADLLFQGSRMEIISPRANIFDANLSNVKIRFADMADPDATLRIEGEATGATREFIKFIEKSALSSYTGGIVGGITAVGDGELQLKLDIPLYRLNDIKLIGSYRFINNQITPSYLPNLDQLDGVLTFTESGIGIEKISAQALGGPVDFRSSTPPEGGMRVTATGKANFDNLRQLARNKPPVATQTWTQHFRGSTDWQAIMNIRKKLFNVSIESSMQGLVSVLPEPFSKAATDPLPLRFERKSIDSRRDDLILRYGGLVAAQIKRSRDSSGNYRVDRGIVSFGTTSTLSPAKNGVTVNGSLQSLDLDQWRSLFKQNDEGGHLSLDPSRINLHIGTLKFLERRFHNIGLNAFNDGGEWNSTISSKEINGDINWHPSGNGKLVARLKNLVIPAASPTKPIAAKQAQLQEKSLPALDVVADNFSVNEKSLGKLELLANQQKQDWHVERLHITNSDSSLTAKGIWQNHAVPPRIQADIKLEASDIGKLLTRLGYPDRVKRGRGGLEGILSWSGNPQSIDYPTLSGSLKLKAKQGQFPKLETGIGKLFSIFDLQSLPRRITLDFRDVLNEGFGFDDITGNVKINRGVATTHDLRIRGSAAKFAMSGEVDLAAETQKLNVRVIPSLGLVTPVVGIASMIANQELKDPFDQVVSSEYNVTGTWADPLITEVAR